MADSKKTPFSGPDIQARWTKGTQDRSTYDREAWENIAFIKGDQWAVWDARNKRFVNPVGDDGTARLRINHIKSMWRSEIATILESRPIPEVLPVTNEDSDAARARNANRVLEHELRRLEWEDKKYEDIQWVTSAGMAYFYVGWKAAENEICLDVCPHFELVVDPSVRRNTKEAMWVIHGKVLTKEEAFEKFGKEFKASDLAGTTNYSKVFSSSNQPEDQGGVLVLRLWHKKSRKYPDGMVKTVINGEVVEDLPYPFEHNEIPYIDMHHIKLPGRYEGQSVVTDLIAPQKDYNATRSRMAEARALHTIKVIAPEGSLDIERISNVAGEVITFRPVGPFEPKFGQLPSVPSFLFQNADTAFSEMQDIASQHEVSRGTVPSSGIPAAGIVALQEKDERRVALVVRQLENATVRVGQQILALAAQFWDKPKKIRVWSEKTGEMSAESMTAEDIKGEYDVYILPGSSTAHSKSQLRQDILNLWDRRVITDPRPVVKILELPTNLGIDQMFTADTKQALREHDHLFAGAEVVAEQWHNHDIHVEEHNLFRKGDIFEQEWEPEHKAALADHVDQHEEFRQAAMEEQMAQAAQQQQLGMEAEMAAEGSEMPQEGTGAVPGTEPQPEA